MNLKALVQILEEGDVGTVVATMGTTGTGSVDRLPEILELRERFGFRLHADAAYGGYYTLVDNLRKETREAYDLLTQVDSIAIDPHKHGLQPYGCGCILFKDPSVGQFYKHDSPYTYFTSTDLHLGEISLECSRAGASAVALWATQRLMPLVRGQRFASDLARCRQAALKVHDRVEKDPRFRVMFSPELDIVAWAPRAGTAGETSRLSERIFHEAANLGLHLAIFRYPSTLLQSLWEEMTFDEPYVTCLRSCMMKPEHEAWVDTVWDIIDKATGQVIRS